MSSSKLAGLASFLLAVGCFSPGAVAKKCVVSYFGYEVPGSPLGPLVRLLRKGHQIAEDKYRDGRANPNEDEPMAWLATNEKLTDEDCGAPLLAAAYGYERVLNLLIDRKVDLYAAELEHGSNETPLTAAAREGRLGIVRMLIERKASKVDETTSLDVKSYMFLPVVNGGETALHLASAGGHADIVRYLLEHGASVNRKTYGRVTSMDIAIKNCPRTVGVIKVLKEYGAEERRPEDLPCGIVGQRWEEAQRSPPKPKVIRATMYAACHSNGICCLRFDDPEKTLALKNLAIEKAFPITLEQGTNAVCIAREHLETFSGMASGIR